MARFCITCLILAVAVNSCSPKGTAVGVSRCQETSLDDLLQHDEGSGDKGDGNSPLHYAAREGNLQACCALLAAGADPNRGNKHGDTPLHWAALGGHMQIVRSLLDRGAHVDARSEFLETPLHLAVDKNHYSTVELLVASGADVNARNEVGDTILDYARTDQLCELLKAEGALRSAPRR